APKSRTQKNFDIMRPPIDINSVDNTGKNHGSLGIAVKRHKMLQCFSESHKEPQNVDALCSDSQIAFCFCRNYVACFAPSENVRFSIISRHKEPFLNY